MNRAAFFAAVRRDLFDGALSQPQVDGLTAILDEWDRRKLGDLRHLAYMQATPFHETGRTMQPIHERGGEAYFRRMYDVAGERPDLARKMGNTTPGDGVKYCGRGFVQLTWKNNYRSMSTPTGVDLVAAPDRAMELPIATIVLFEGMLAGTFTGKKLADYFHEGTADWIGARKIINGTDKAQTIASYGKAFYAALLEAAEATPEPAPRAPPPTAPAPIPTPQPAPPPPPTPSQIPAPPQASSWVALVVDFILALLGKKGLRP